MPIDIESELNSISTAVYGEEVRGSFINALNKIKNEVDPDVYNSSMQYIVDMASNGSSWYNYTVHHEQNDGESAFTIPYYVEAGKKYAIQLLSTLYSYEVYLNVFVVTDSANYVTVSPYTEEQEFIPTISGYLRIYVPGGSSNILFEATVGIRKIDAIDYILQAEITKNGLSTDFYIKKTNDGITFFNIWLEEGVEYDILISSDSDDINRFNCGIASRFNVYYTPITRGSKITHSFGRSGYLRIYVIDSYSATSPIKATVTISKHKEEISVSGDDVKTYRVGTNQEYTNFTQLLRELEDDDSEKIIYLEGGVYDIYNELGGASYINGLSTSANLNWRDVQPVVSPNTKIIGVGNVLLRFSVEPSEIDSSHQSLMFLFSPINLSGTCRLENLSIEAKNCRYCIHDETSTLTEYDYGVHEFIGIHAKMLNGTLGHGGCYVAGHGTRMRFLFEDCYFETEVSGKPAWSTHDSTLHEKSYDGSIYRLHNCQFKPTSTNGPAFRLSSSDQSTSNTVMDRVYLSNCYLKGKLFFQTENSALSNVSQRYKVIAIGCNEFEFSRDANVTQNLVDPEIYNTIS